MGICARRGCRIRIASRPLCFIRWISPGLLNDSMSGALDMAFGAFNKWVVRWSIAVLVASLSMLSGCGVSMEGRAKKLTSILMVMKK